MNKSMKKNIRHFFLLTAFAAGTIHLVNRFIDFTASMKNILKTENGNYFDWKNGKIYYTKRGSGTPVLLIHDLVHSVHLMNGVVLQKNLKNNIRYTRSIS